MGRTVLLVRHASHAELGNVLSGRSDISLSEHGRNEAERLATALGGVTLASLHSSPRPRARETIASLASVRGMEVVVSRALDEIDFGRFTGRTFADLDGDPAWVRWNAERATARCPGGETMAEAVARAGAYLDALPDEAFPALCVTHCDIVRGLVADRLALGLDWLLMLGCDPASRTTLDWRDHGRLIALNERVA